MKLIFYEILKLLKNKFFIFLFICLAAGSIISFSWTQLSFAGSNGYSEEKIFLSDKDSYNSALNEFDGLSAEKAVAKADEKKELYEMCKMIIDEMSIDDTGADTQSALDSFRQQDKATFDKAMSIINENTDFEKKCFLYDYIGKKYRYIQTYDIFINEMENRAERQLEFSIFKDNDAFSENNIKKTVQDYENIKGTVPQAGNFLFAEHGTNFFLTDVMVLSVLFLLCVCLFMQERDKGLLLLVKSSRNGHIRTASAKLITLVIFTAVSVVLFYGTELVVSGIIYGFPDMNVPVQSMSDFMDCSLKISVAEYIVLWLLSKLAALVIIALLFAAVFGLFRSTVLIWLVSIGTLVLEYALYIFIPANSSFCHPHFINLFYFLDSKTLLADYENLNFFSKPINILVIFLVCFLLLSAIFSVISVIAFSRKSQIPSKSIVSSLIEKLQRRFFRINGSVSVFRHELYKRLIHDKGFIILAALLIFAVQVSVQTIDVKYDSLQDVSYYVYLERLEGKLTDEKEQFIQDEQKYFDNLQNEFFELQAKENPSEEDKNRLTNMDNILKGKYQGFQKIMSKYEYLKEQKEKNGTEIWFVNEKKYSTLLTDRDGSTLRFVICGAALILIVGNIFSIEYKRNMKRLLRSSANGKKRLFAAKFGTALFCGTLSFLLIYPPVLIQYLANFKTILIEAPVSSIQELSACGGMTILTFILLLGLIHLVMSELIALFVCSMSELTRNYFLTLMLSTVILLVVYILISGNPELRFYTILGMGRITAFVTGAVVISVIIAVLIIVSKRRYTNDSIRRQRKWSCK